MSELHRCFPPLFALHTNLHVQDNDPHHSDVTRSRFGLILRFLPQNLLCIATFRVYHSCLFKIGFIEFYDRDRKKTRKGRCLLVFSRARP